MFTEDLAPKKDISPEIIEKNFKIFKEGTSIGPQEADHHLRIRIKSNGDSTLMQEV